MHLPHSMLKPFVKQPVIVKESPTSIKNLYDTTIDFLHGYSTLDINVSSWDTIVIF